MIESIVKIVIVFAVIVAVLLAGFDMGRQSAFVNYCEYQGGKYEQIDDIDYCIVDNQLQQIEWVK